MTRGHQPAPHKARTAGGLAGGWRRAGSAAICPPHLESMEHGGSSCRYRARQFSGFEEAEEKRRLLHERRAAILVWNILVLVRWRRDERAERETRACHASAKTCHPTGRAKQPARRTNHLALCTLTGCAHWAQPVAYRLWHSLRVRSRRDLRCVRSGTLADHTQLTGDATQRARTTTGSTTLHVPCARSVAFGSRLFRSVIYVFGSSSRFRDRGHPRPPPPGVAAHVCSEY